MSNATPNLLLQLPADPKQRAELEAAFINLRGNSAWQVAYAWMLSEQKRLDVSNRSAKGRLLKQQQGACQVIESLEYHYSGVLKARKP